MICYYLEREECTCNWRVKRGRDAARYTASEGREGKGHGTAKREPLGKASLRSLLLDGLLGPPGQPI
mgnify:CR=1 FL=1